VVVVIKTAFEILVVVGRARRVQEDEGLNGDIMA
jgi:hypothetical protein